MLDIFEALNAILNETVKVRIDGVPMRMTREEARLWALTRKAAGGDAAAMRELRREQRLFPGPKAEDTEAQLEAAKRRVAELFPSTVPTVLAEGAPDVEAS